MYSGSSVDMCYCTKWNCGKTRGNNVEIVQNEGKQNQIYDNDFACNWCQLFEMLMSLDCTMPLLKLNQIFFSHLSKILLFKI